MRKESLLIIFFGIVFASFSGCKDDKDDPQPQPPPVTECVGGTGGNLTLIARTVHHTRAIKGCKVYIKYNTNLFPGEVTSVYDDSLQIPADTVEGAFMNLKCGKYFLYATGIDSVLDPASWIVKGGIPFSTQLDSGTVNVTVYVTEGD